MRKYILLAICLSLFFFLIEGPTEAETSEVEIISHSSYLGIFGNYHVVGEVENKGTFPLTSFKITAKFYDSQGGLIDEDFANLMLDILPPGYKAPFHITYINIKEASKIESYVLEMDYVQTSKLPPVKLEFESQDSYVDDDGWMHITGTIKNNGEDTRFVEVIVTCYDENGEVSCVEYSFAEPRDVKSGQTASFEIVIPYRVDLIEDYALLSQSEDLVSIDEFPLDYILTTIFLAFIIYYSVFLHLKKENKNLKK